MQDGIPLSLGIIVAAAIFSATTFVLGMVLMTVLLP